MNRAQKIIGFKLTGVASIEMRKWFNQIKNKDWYKPIDLFLIKTSLGFNLGKFISFNFKTSGPPKLSICIDLVIKIFV